MCLFCQLEWNLSGRVAPQTVSQQHPQWLFTSSGLFSLLNISPQLFHLDFLLCKCAIKTIMLTLLNSEWWVKNSEDHYNYTVNCQKLYQSSGLSVCWDPGPTGLVYLTAAGHQRSCWGLFPWEASISPPPPLTDLHRDSFVLQHYTACN